MAREVRLRFGIGFDVHRYAEGRRFVLGGVEVVYGRGLLGHSDADVLSHAIADAVLGACALGDLGDHFPAGDARWKDAPSLDLLRRAVVLAGEAGYRVLNVDSVVVAEEPRLKDYRAAMRERLAGAMGLAVGEVSVKLKSAEGLGALGRIEGVAAHAVVGVESTP